MPICFSSYAEITKSPAAAESFLTQCLTLSQTPPDRPMALTQQLSSEIEVAGKPFSASAFMIQLDSHSQEWDLHEEPRSVVASLHDKAQKLDRMERDATRTALMRECGWDIAGSITGLQQLMLELPSDIASRENRAATLASKMNDTLSVEFRLTR